MSAKPWKKPATYADVYDVPEHCVAEIFDGALYASPRPALPHAHAASVLGVKLGAAFHRDGPGGWVILDEPELHFGDDVLVPDLAGWRRERVPTLPADAYMTLAPDWVCEVLSASSEALDRGVKLRIYAREGIPYAWLLDPLRQSLEALRLQSGAWAPLAEYRGGAHVRVSPFEAAELDLGALWIARPAP